MGILDARCSIPCDSVGANSGLESSVFVGDGVGRVDDEELERRLRLYGGAISASIR